MALARVSGFTTKKSSSQGTTWSSIAIDTTAAAGSQVILILSTDGVSADTDNADHSRHSTITDTKSNVWTKLKEWEVQKFDSRTAIVSVWFGQITTQLAAGTDTLTVTTTGTFDDNDYKIICSEKFTGAVGGFTVAQALTEVLDVADYADLTISSLSNIERLYVRAWASEGQSNAGTVSSNYTLFTDAFSSATLQGSGADATSMKGGGEYRILTGTGDSSNPTATTPGGRSVSVYLALTPINNTPPVLGAIGNQTASVGVAMTKSVSATDADAADVLDLSIIAGAQTGLAQAQGHTTSPVSGDLTWTPTRTQASATPYDVTVQVTDGTDTDNEAFTITVSNDAPTLAVISNQTWVHAVQGTVTAVGSDINGDTLAYTIQSGGQTGLAIDSSSGVITWTPTMAQVSATPYSVVIRVTDNGVYPATLYAERTFTITVTNTAPVLGAIGDKSATPNVQLAFTATATDSDQGDTLTFSLINSPPTGASITSGGDFTWTPTHAQASLTDYDVTVQVSDGTDTDFETFQVTVANTAPTMASIANQTWAVGVPSGITPSASDVNTGDSLAFSLETDPGLSNSDFSFSTGRLSSTPETADIAGSPFTAKIRVTDNGVDAELYAERTFTITITANHPPVLDAIGTKNGVVGTQISFTATVTDDGGDVDSFSINSVVDVVGAAINSGSGAFTWTPTKAGTYTIRFTATDVGGLTDYEDVVFRINSLTISSIPTTGSPAHQGKVSSRVSAPKRPR